MQTIDFKRLQLRNGDRILDVGCGEGRHTIGAYLSAEVEAIGIDLSENDLQTAQERFDDFEEKDNPRKSVQFQRANALKLPFDDNSFDKVVCSEVLEHIPDYKGVLQEIDRVLKPNGLLAVSVPRAWPEEICWRLSRPYRQVEGGHIRIFNATQLRHDVEDIGWRRYARHWAHALHSPFWWLKCWNWGNDDAWLVKQYHRFLVWDLMQQPWITRTLEKLLDPIMGKSVVMYFQREPAHKIAADVDKESPAHG
ncbi:class I SAM-dependent methyltransferase [Pseudomaricurvus alkylphenolicus]|uniref:class I SAM-dependent methyltransferase n=1 Tax=Pseudomaricurvus alkylphenolicus TaxID=1306991 RepID=UPI001422D0CB|nr:class I SAM-dependent methyltransferase [Pseudomaricurvus alkylphenolicus]NIB43037.1 class I SAM-dependent methyltransferase [Pseudomaricurvus alkylphenolicus]